MDFKPVGGCATILSKYLRVNGLQWFFNRKPYVLQSKAQPELHFAEPKFVLQNQMSL
jgi:hypothetical protein